MLIGFAALFGLLGQMALVASTPTPPEPNHSGLIAVYTNDPKAQVHLWVAPEHDQAGDTFPDYRWLGTHLEIKAAKRPVRWAVAFGGDAAFPPGELPVSGTVASFSQPLGGSFTIDLGTQVRRPLLQDAKEHVTLSTPTLGRVESLTNDQGGAILSSFQREGVAPRLANILQRSIWHAPASVRAEFMAFTLTGVRQESGTAPSAPFRTEWAAKDTLKLEVLFGPERDPVVPLRRQAHQTGSATRR